MLHFLMCAYCHVENISFLLSAVKNFNLTNYLVNFVDICTSCSDGLVDNMIKWTFNSGKVFYADGDF